MMGSAHIPLFVTTTQPCFTSELVSAQTRYFDQPARRFRAADIIIGPRHLSLVADHTAICSHLSTSRPPAWPAAQATLSTALYSPPSPAPPRPAPTVAAQPTPPVGPADTPSSPAPLQRPSRRASPRRRPRSLCRDLAGL